MKIAIVDDLDIECELLEQYLTRYAAEHQMLFFIQKFQNGKDFLNVFSTQSFNLLFLDICMDSPNGMEIAHAVRSKDTSCLIVFSTTSKDYAIEGYRVRAFDYLVKPYSYEDFCFTMTECAQAMNEWRKFIEVKEGRLFVKILLSEILYVDYFNHYIQIHTPRRIIKSYTRFVDFQKRMEPYKQFLNCYRNCMINMDMVSSLNDKEFTLKNGEIIPISRNMRQEIRQKYADYEFTRLNSGGAYYGL